MFDKTTIQGAYFAISAYLIWGVAPIYFKLIDYVSPLEILVQRVIWSAVLLVGILAYTGQLSKLKIAKKKLAMVFLSAALLSCNWLLFIYAIVNNNIVETSLGYFINPLFSILLGLIFLGERPRPLQWIAIFIAFSGIAFQLIFYGHFPWIALTLAFSFGFYGLIRKTLNLHSIAGLALETLIVSPFAIAGFIWLYLQGELQFAHIDLKSDLLLIASGLVTSAPLLCFAAAITRLSLSTSGMFQYIAPSVSLIIAVLIYNEPFGIDRLITFSCIWFALALFVFETIHHHRRIQLQGRGLNS